MSRALKQLIAVVLLLGLAFAAGADQLLMVRSGQLFPEAMSTLQNALTARGYKISRVQNVDKGLSHTGYRTDNYKVVFYGKAEEVAELAAKHLELIPYLPLNVGIFSEGNNTLLVTNRPGVLADFFPDPELKAIFMRWEKDLTEVMNEVREAR
jgi:uncharacterized protein (DUF302 family)